VRIFVMFILSRACVYDVINLSLLSCSLSTPKGQAKVVRFCEEKKRREIRSFDGQRSTRSVTVSTPWR
jgi:hypothetical protein